MTRRFHLAVVGLVLLAGATGCDSATPLTPTSLPPAPPATSTDPPPPASTAISVTGWARDRAWRPLLGVRVEVLDGPDAGLSTVTDAAGEFGLVGEFDSATRFRASSPEHREVTSVLMPPCDRCPNRLISFSLETTAASADLTGEYSVTFEADPACTRLPEEFRRRTYSATVRPISPHIAAQFNVKVRGGTFLAGYDEFVVGVAGDAFSASLGDFHGSPGVAERVSTNGVLAFDGYAQVSDGVVDASTVSAPLEGTISFCELRGEPAERYACESGQTVARVLCTSTKHQLILQRTASALRSR